MRVFMYMFVHVFRVCVYECVYMCVCVCVCVSVFYGITVTPHYRSVLTTKPPVRVHCTAEGLGTVGYIV